MIKTIYGFKMFLDPRDRVISRSIKKRGFYDKKGTAIIRNVLREGNIFVNVGAHIGYLSFVAASIVGNKGQVFAFEPGPENFRIFQQNIKLNGFKNITAIQKAILDKKKKVNLFLSKTNTGDHRTYESDETRRFIEVDAINLDDFFDKRDKKIDFIKIDVQGSEMNVLNGMTKILKRKPLKMFIEFWPYGITANGDDPKKLLDLIIKNGFKIISPAMKTRELLNKYTPENQKFENLFCVKGD